MFRGMSVNFAGDVEGDLPLLSHNTHTKEVSQIKQVGPGIRSYSGAIRGTQLPGDRFYPG